MSKGQSFEQRTLDWAEYAKLCVARDTLCGFCENDACERCIVTLLLDQAANEAEAGLAEDAS